MNARSLAAGVAAVLFLVACATEPISVSRTITHNVVLSPVGSSGASGLVRIVLRTRQPATVSVELGGLRPGLEYRGHVHRGGCATDTATTVALGLPDLRAGSNGQAVGSLSVARDSALNAGYYIEYHATATTAGPSILCGDIPAITRPPNSGVPD